GAVGDALGRWPVESVVIARIADQLRGVHALPCDLLEQVEVVLLSVDVGETGADRADLVAADSAVDDFLRSSRRVEPPTAIGLHYRNGQWPVIRSHVQHH